jgi:hypothetical protein
MEGWSRRAVEQWKWKPQELMLHRTLTFSFNLRRKPCLLWLKDHDSFSLKILLIFALMKVFLTAPPKSKSFAFMMATTHYGYVTTKLPFVLLSTKNYEHTYRHKSLSWPQQGHNYTSLRNVWFVTLILSYCGTPRSFLSLTHS